MCSPTRFFPQVGLRFLEHRGDPSAFEPRVEEAVEPSAPPAAEGQAAAYSVRVNGKAFRVEVAPDGDVKAITAATPAKQRHAGAITAALAGMVFKVLVKPGDAVDAGEPVAVLEAMKMETEVTAPAPGTVEAVFVREGDAVELGDELLSVV